MNRLKRILSIAVCAVLVTAGLLVSPTRAQAAIPAFEEAVIVSDGVNMRLRPTVDSPFVLKLLNGTRVGVFCEEVDGWYRIIYGNYRGYVSKEFVFLPSTDLLVGNVLEDETPVYQNAGSFSQQVDMLSAGMGVTVVSMQRDHYCVEYTPGDTAVLPEAAAEPEVPVQEGEPPAEQDAQEEEQESVALSAGQQGADEDVKRGYVLKEALRTSNSKNAMGMVREGMKGVEVTKLQRELQKRGFLSDSATGEFGTQTREAVALFQQFADLDADGVAGAKTLELLYGDNDIRCTYAQRMGLKDEIQLLPWDEVAEKYIPKEKVYTVMDVRTGITWKEYRFGGWFHSDTVPLTAEDTAKMKEAVGEWTWERRPVWVLVDGINIAASMNCMPHLSNPIAENGFGGHHCIHFYKSKVHETSAECPRHAAQVQFAYKMGQES